MPRIELDKDLIKLKELRESKNITQDEMAEALGITKMAYWMKENGKTAITLVEADLISKRLKKSINEIFFKRV